MELAQKQEAQLSLTNRPALILLQQRAAVMYVVFLALRIYAIPFDALDERDSLELSSSYLVREN